MDRYQIFFATFKAGAVVSAMILIEVIRAGISAKHTLLQFFLE
jgi:hypothetical protein